MKDKDKTKEQLVSELEEMRQRVAVLEKSEVKHEQAEKVLPLPAEDYQRLFETFPIGITLLDMKGVMLYCNPAVYKKGGYAKGEFTGKHFSKIAPIGLKDIPKFIRVFNSIVRGKIPKPFEVIYTRKDGTTGWSELSIDLVKMGRKRRILVVQHDITERKQAEEALEESGEKYRLLFNSSNNPTTVYDSNGVLQLMNEMAAASIGGVPADFIGKPISKIHPSVAQTAMERIRTVIETEESREFDTVVDLPSGRHWFWSNFQPVKDANGNVNAVQIISYDITERKEAEKELRELYEKERALRNELEIELSKRVQLAMALVHELRTPLTAIVSSSELLAESAKDEMSQRLANNISQSASVLDKRIGELLDLASGEIGLLQLALKPVDFSQLMDLISEETGALLSSKNLSLDMELPSSLPTVFVDEDRLRQVILNLLGNAIKYSHEGGTITLRARQDNADLIVEVEDKGIGLTNEEQQHVFEPYRRMVDGDRSIGGLGIGLAISKNLVELHGGKIWVNSRKGVGSIFGFSIPLKVANEDE